MAERLPKENQNKLDSEAGIEEFTKVNIIKSYSRLWVVCIINTSLQYFFRVVYHKYWHCQLSSLNKKDGTKRNKNCSATLDILIKKVNRDTINNDREFLEQSPPLPAVITLKKCHSHKVEDFYESLGFLRVTEETKQIFFE